MDQVSQEDAFLEAFCYINININININQPSKKHPTLGVLTGATLPALCVASPCLPKKPRGQRVEIIDGLRLASHGAGSRHGNLADEE